MRGLVFRRRIYRLAVIAAAVFIVVYVYFMNDMWLCNYLEKKVSEFTGGRFKVTIDQVTGGVFENLVMQDISFVAKNDAEKRNFRLERIEVSKYIYWQAVLDKIGLLPGKKYPLKELAIFFSDTNPFVRGYIILNVGEDKVDVVGVIEPLVFGERTKRPIKGTFRRSENGDYTCQLRYDKNKDILGTFMPDDKRMRLQLFRDMYDGNVTIDGAISGEEDIGLYIRFYKWYIADKCLIGDIWIDISGHDEKGVMVKAENLLLDETELWNLFLSARYNDKNKLLRIDKAIWGDDLSLSGKIVVGKVADIDLAFKVKDFDLEELGRITGRDKDEITGILNSTIHLQGHADTADVNGRLFVNDGNLGELEFKSIFASLEGRIPVIKIVDARAVKDGGNILISGELDFRKDSADKVFEGVVFDTDNRVAVWEDWQISKREDTRTVQATKDNFTLRTLFDDDRFDIDNRHDTPVDFEFDYSVDGYNSLKLDFSEEDDFLGIEHKFDF